MAELSELEFAVCVSTFYEDLAERLVNGAVEAFGEQGVAPTSVHRYEGPGAYELTLAAKWSAESGRFAGVACLGVVIRGETNHYDYVCAEAARGVQRVQLDTGVPCAFGVITRPSPPHTSHQTQAARTSKYPWATARHTTVRHAHEQRVGRRTMNADRLQPRCALIGVLSFSVH